MASSSDMGEHGAGRAGAGPAAGALPPRLPRLPADILSVILSYTSPRDLHSFAAASRSCLALADHEFKARCEERDWRLPRSQRFSSKYVDMPYRMLHRRRSCSACGRERGEFACRLKREGPALALLCRRCTGAANVRRRLEREMIMLDLIGLTGRHLLTKRDLARPKRRRRPREHDNDDDVIVVEGADEGDDVIVVEGADGHLDEEEFIGGG